MVGGPFTREIRLPESLCYMLNQRMGMKEQKPLPSSQTTQRKAEDQQRSFGVRGSAALSADLIKRLGARDATRKSPMSRAERDMNTR